MQCHSIFYMYTLHPHSHTCRTHFNHVASQWDSNMTISIKTKLRIKYSFRDRRCMIEPKALKYAHYSPYVRYTLILTHTEDTSTMSPVSESWTYQSLKLRIKFRASEMNSVWWRAKIWNNMHTVYLTRCLGSFVICAFSYGLTCICVCMFGCGRHSHLLM